MAPRAERFFHLARNRQSVWHGSLQRRAPIAISGKGRPRGARKNPPLLHNGPPIDRMEGAVMPTRLVRDGILRSRKIAALDPMAELFYRRLMSVTDDFGRYYADPALLLSDCFPIRPPWADENGIAGWLEACLACGLIRAYEANGTAFLEIQNFGQRIRPGQTSKFPQPAEICGGARENSALARASNSPSPPIPTTPSAPALALPANFDFSDWFERQYARHPPARKKHRTLAAQAAAQAYSEGKFMLEEFEASHIRWCESEHWQWKGGLNAPSLDQWIADGGWKYDPPSAMPAAEENWQERALRA